MTTHEIYDTTNPFLPAAAEILLKLYGEAPWLFWDAETDKACPAPDGDVAPISRTKGDDHVTWHGDWPAEVRALPVHLCNSSDKKSQQWRPLSHKTWGAFLDDFLTKPKARVEKGGTGFTQGEVRDGGRRTKENMVTLYAVSLDIESGDTEAEVREKLNDLGWASLTYSTFSHGKTETTIPNDVILKFSGVPIPAAVTEDHVRRFLVEKKGMRPSAVADITVAPGPKKERIVTHPPIDRFRVVIPLAEPFVVVDHGETNSQAADVWSAFYRGVAKTLGVWHDESCEDLSRFVWGPTYPKDSDNYFVNVIGGRALTWDEIEPVQKEKTGRQGAKKSAKANAPKTFDLPWLPKFWAKYANRFRAADFFTAHYEERGSGSDGKVTTECPFDGLHSDPGNSDDNGFFARNWDASQEGDDGEGRAFCRCSHTHGSSGEHSTLDYIHEACHAHGITDWRDLADYVDELKGDGPYSLDEFVEPFTGYEDAKAAIEAVEEGDLIAGGKIARRLGKTKMSASEKEDCEQRLKRVSGLGLRAIKAESKAAKSKGKSGTMATRKDGGPDWLPNGYEIDNGSIWRVSGDDDESRLEVCAAFYDPALKRDQDGGGWGLRIKFKDADGIEHERIISRDRLVSDSQSVLAELSSEGLNFPFMKQSKDWLVTLLGEVSRSRDLPRVREVNRPGWHRDGALFVTPLGEVIAGPDQDGAETVILADGAGVADRGQRGTLDGSKGVFAACFALPAQWHWALSACAAFAGPVLQLLGDTEESGGICIVGLSGHGKTTGLAVQTSAWTNPRAGKGTLVELRGTVNSLESACRVATGTSLALNEAHHMPVKDYSELPFMVTGGVEKGRKERNGNGNRATIGWSVFALISSEKHARDILATENKKQQAGHVGRFPEVNISGTMKLAANDATLKTVMGYSDHYGRLGPAFVRGLIAEGWTTEEGRERLRIEVVGLAERLSGGSKDMTRPARKFALVEWAGLAARRYDLLPADADVSGQIDKAWDTFRHGDDAIALQGVDRAIEALRTSIVTRWDRTIVNVEGSGPDYGPDAVGFYDDTAIYILADKLATLAGGTDTAKAIAKELNKRGWLERQRKDELVGDYIPRKGSLRHYRLDLIEFAPDDAVTEIAEIDAETGARTILGNPFTVDERKALQEANIASAAKDMKATSRRGNRF